MLWLWIVLGVVAVSLFFAWRSDRKERKLGHTFRGAGQMGRQALRNREMYESNPKLADSLSEGRSGHEQDQES